jgi:DNA (cytosine-5)-methyltransferase 1
MKQIDLFNSITNAGTAADSGQEADCTSVRRHSSKPHVIGSQLHRFPYRWNLKDAEFAKDKGKVFSCFACGGGSTMGYKLAGFDVIGCNEIDPKMIEAYKANHNPKYAFLEPIQTFKDRQDLPDELYQLDILDGSPPCSSFSMAGNREKDWGKEKVFREGQAEQVLDTLFFDFIDLAKKLQPKIVIAENVKGLLMGNAKHYYRKVHKELIAAGYSVTAILADASKMGVPQKRERVFVIGVRLDIAEKLKFANVYVPEIDLNFNEPEIPFCEIDSKKTIGHKNGTLIKLWNKLKEGESGAVLNKKGSFFGYVKIFNNKPLPTLTNGGKQVTVTLMHPFYDRYLNDDEIILGQTFPMDYYLSNRNHLSHIVTMSVPPLMTAHIASEVFSQWLAKLG